MTDFFRALRGYSMLLLIATVCGGSSGALLSVMRPRAFEARAELLMTSEPRVFVTGNSPAPLSIPNELRLVNSARVREAVRLRLGTVGPVATEPIAGTDAFAIVAHATSAGRATSIVDAYVTAYTDLKRQTELDRLSAARAEIARHLAALQSDADARHADAIAEQAGLRQRLTDITLDESLVTAGVQVVTPAAAVESPFVGRVIRNSVLAASLALFVGATLAMLIELREERVRSYADLRRHGPSVPVIAYVALQNAVVKVDGTKGSLALLQVDALTSVAGAIEFVAVHRAVAVIAITSAGQEEAKARTVVGLGVALARRSRKVVIVGCDFWDPRVHTELGLSNAVGLSTVLTRKCPLRKAIQAVPDVPTLSFLSAGPLPADPVGALADQDTGLIFKALQAHFDLILIDAPPVVSASGALFVAAWADISLLTVTVGETTRLGLSRAREVLQHAQSSLIGIIVCGSDDSGRSWDRHVETDNGRAASFPPRTQSSI